MGFTCSPSTVGGCSPSLSVVRGKDFVLTSNRLHSCCWQVSTMRKLTVPFESQQLLRRDGIHLTNKAGQPKPESTREGEIPQQAAKTAGDRVVKPRAQSGGSKKGHDNLQNHVEVASL